MKLWRKIAEDRELAGELKMVVRQLEHELAEARIELHEFRVELATSVAAVTGGAVDAKLERLRQALTGSIGLKLDQDFRETR